MWTSVSDQTNKTALQDWRAQVVANAFKAMNETIPAKILELNAIIAGLDNPLSPYNKTHLAEIAAHPIILDEIKEESSKKRKLEANGHTPTGSSVKFTARSEPPPQLIALLDLLRTEWETMHSLMEDLRLYITLQIPKAESGDNSGVATQEECLQECVRAQDNATMGIVDSTYKYCAQRAKLISKLLKYPNSGDYQLALRDYDRSQFWLCQQRLKDIRHIYAVVGDVLHKNIEKIVAPRSDNSRDMY